MIYFSTRDMLYSLKDSNVVLLTDKYAGTLRYYNGGLMVFDTEKNILIRIEGIDNKIIPRSSERVKN